MAGILRRRDFGNFHFLRCSRHLWHDDDTALPQAKGESQRPAVAACGSAWKTIFERGTLLTQLAGNKERHITANISYSSILWQRCNHRSRERSSFEIDPRKHAS